MLPPHHWRAKARPRSRRAVDALDTRHLQGHLHCLVDIVANRRGGHLLEACRAEPAEKHWEALILTNRVEALEHIVDRLGLLSRLFAAQTACLQETHLHPSTHHIQRVRRRLRRCAGDRADEEESGRCNGTARHDLEVALEHLVDHELDTDVREHGKQRGRQPAVEALEPSVLDDALEGLVNPRAFFGIHGAQRLDDLEWVHYDGRAHACNAAGTQTGKR
mmetsp:Transcript_62/g.197  ORF Transcript_62/g.197 Transcript_62/m.197 type:complete len:220 (+) Transcript_62:758-1417(+)